MYDIQAKNRMLDGLAWGAFFVWWGITELFQLLPGGTWALGFGLILLGLNAARMLNGLPTSGFTITVGVLAFVWGGLEVAGFILSLPFELPVFSIVLIVFGMIVLGRELARSRVQQGDAKW